MISPLGLYIVLAAIVAAYGRNRPHGFWRLLALAVVFTPLLGFLYCRFVGRRMTDPT